MKWLIVAIVVIVLIAIAAFVIMRKRQQQRTEQLRDRFGPEYDRTVDRTGKQGQAEKDLERRAEKRDELQIRDLEPAARERYAARWDESQHLFVDDPSKAISQADQLVHEVMRERGYPADDFDSKADVISVDHPDLVENYRGAHGTAARAAREPISTEDQRQAMVHFRGLFDELLGAGRSAGDHASAGSTSTPPPSGERGAGAVASDAGRGTEGTEGAQGAQGAREAEPVQRDPGPDPERTREQELGTGDPDRRSGTEPRDDEPRGSELPR